MSNGGKALQAGDHHIILAERTVDDEHVSAFISATYDSHMLIIGIEHQIAGLGLKVKPDCHPLRMDSSKAA